MRSRTAEDALSKRLGRDQLFKNLRVRIAHNVEHLGPDGGYLVLCCDLEEGRECGEIRYFVPLGESVDRDGQQCSSLRYGKEAYAGRYTIFRSVVKSIAVSEDKMRGQPLGDSAVTKFSLANIRPSTGEWNGKTPA